MTRRTWWLLALLVGGLALAAAANSLPNGFAYDDVYVIEKQPRMHSLRGWWREFGMTYWLSEGGKAGDGYRPLTILAFKAQWVAGGGNPAVFHGVNVALHVAGAVAVFWLACAALPLAAAWIAAALYAVHPVHVEAIANVVGQSELVVALLLTVATALYVHGRAAGPLGAARWGVIGGLYAIAMLFKEHAITLIALIALAELTIVADRSPLRARWTRLRPALLALTVVAAAYLWARSRVVVGTSGFEPYIVFQGLDTSTGDRILTMIGASTEWVRLLLWPARLMTEYAPPYIEVAQGLSIAQLPGLLVLLGVLGLLVATWRRSPGTALGLGWLVITLLPASNFVLPAGFIIAERTLLLPSAGAMIALATVVPWAYARLETRRAAQWAAAAGVVVLLALGLARSYTRNPVWRDNATLFGQAVQDSPESYRAHFMLGTHLFESGRLQEGETHYRHALRLFPYDPLMAIALAERYRGAGMCAPALPLYEWFFAMEPTATRGHLGMAQCLLLSYRFDEAREAALRSIRVGGRVRPARELIAAAMAARDSLRARSERELPSVTQSAPPSAPQSGPPLVVAPPSVQ